MSRFPEAGLALALIALAAPALADGYGLGREATPAEVAAWDIDVRPDGQGLPEGSGDVLTGEEVFAEQCAHCHGDFGEGVDRWPVLAGGQDSLTQDRPVKTIGSYWPYLSTVYDYINRAMPFGYAQSLAPDDVYAITAYLLYMNDVVDDDAFVLSHENFGEIRLPNEDNFVDDPRPDIPNLADGAPCMADCKETAPEIVMRAVILDVTPESEDGENAGLSVD
ncbi:MAG: cytochrome c [Pseudomonadota bacterium]